MYLFRLFPHRNPEIKSLCQQGQENKSVVFWLSHKAHITNTSRACTALLSQSHLGEDFHGSSWNVSTKTTPTLCWSYFQRRFPLLLCKLSKCVVKSVGSHESGAAAPAGEHSSHILAEGPWADHLTSLTSGTHHKREYQHLDRCPENWCHNACLALWLRDKCSKNDSCIHSYPIRCKISWILGRVMISEPMGEQYLKIPHIH